MCRANKKSKKITQKNELFLQGLELLKWEKRVFNETNQNISENTLIGLSDEEKKILKLCKNLNEYENISQNLFTSSYQQGYIKNKNLQKKFETIFKSPLFTNEDKALSIIAKIQYHNIYAEYYRTINDQHHYYSSMKKLIELADSEAYKEQVELKQYISMFFNYLLACYTIRKFSEVLNLLEKFRSISATTVKDKAGIFVRSHQLEQAVYLAQGRQQESSDLEIRIIDGLAQYDTLIEPRHRIVLEYQMFYLCFCEARFKAALPWINNVLNGDQKYRVDIISAAKLANLVLHYELENFELLEHLILSTFRYLNKGKKISPHEKLICNFFKNNLENLITNYNLTSLFQDLREQLSIQINKPKEKQVLDYFNWFVWLDSKIDKLTMLEIIKKNSKER